MGPSPVPHALKDFLTVNLKTGAKAFGRGGGDCGLGLSELHVGRKASGRNVCEISGKIQVLRQHLPVFVALIAKDQHLRLWP